VWFKKNRHTYSEKSGLKCGRRQLLLSIGAATWNMFDHVRSGLATGETGLLRDNRSHVFDSSFPKEWAEMWKEAASAFDRGSNLEYG
jgi:hypothetical protein